MKNGLISSTINFKNEAKTKKKCHFSARAWNTTEYIDLAFGAHVLEMKRSKEKKNKNIVD